MTDDKLIEEAAKAIHTLAQGGESWLDARMAERDQYRDEARAAFAVFEKAQAEPVTVTDDMVTVALDAAYERMGELTDEPISEPDDIDRGAMRAALEAALSPKEEK